MDMLSFWIGFETVLIYFIAFLFTCGAFYLTGWFPYKLSARIEAVPMSGLLSIQEAPKGAEGDLQIASNAAEGSLSTTEEQPVKRGLLIKIKDPSIQAEAMRILMELGVKFEYCYFADSDSEEEF